MPRFHCPVPLHSGAVLSLPERSARHVQVLRLQPGAAITLFDGAGGEWDARITHMGRSKVTVGVAAHHANERPASRPVHLALGMPANERMDWLVEKATELGVASIQPLHTTHSVLRLHGERALKKQAHWQSVAIAACEQCGANRVPLVHPVRDFSPWLAHSAELAQRRCVLSLATAADALTVALDAADAAAPVLFLGGPEGGLTAAEEAAARASGFHGVTLGPRVLRSETAALAALVTALCR